MVWFDIPFLAGALVLRPVNLYLGWQGFTFDLSNRDVPASALVGLAAFGIFIPLALWWLASRRRSRVAAWLIVLWVGFNLASYALSLWEGRFEWGPNTALALAILGLCVVACIALFHPDSRRLRAGKPTAADLERDFS